jgi:DNA repair protein RecN (Recombination protein N)
VITYLKVRNLAIVEEFEIEPGAGLNVLTGETGAGKSLLIDSLELLRGARSSSEMIRSGAEKMSAEAVFALPVSLAPSLAALGIDVDGDAKELELIVRRELSIGGRGRVMINGSPVSVRELGAAMDAALEIHGQNESHQKVAGQTFRELLDEYGQLETQVEETAKQHALWREAATHLESLRGAERDRALRIDLLRYQIDEIAAARIDDPEEETTLRSERTILSHARELGESTAGAFALIEDEESAALPQLARAQHLLQPLSRQVPELGQLCEELQDAIYRLQEVARSVSSFADSIRLDPERLETVEDRLVTLERLRKKYGGSIEAVLTHLESSSAEYEQLRDYETNLARADREENTAFTHYQKAAEMLSKGRRRAAESFQKAIQSELNDLAMERTTVRVDVTTAADRDSRLTIDGTGIAFGPEGFDRIEILIAPNRGEEPKPLQRIASGGELSRIQLAIAAALFKRSTNAAAATLVFDEVDAGIGGRVAEVVGRKLQELSAHNQVICVTHLPQIAAFGTTHFQVWKEDVGGHTRARIKRLDDRDARIEEIGRMLAGESITASARQHAAELLDGAHGRAARART